MAGKPVRTFLLAAAAGLVLTACGDEDSTEAGSASVAPTNRPPVISGDPNATVMQGEVYSFTPKASDPDGDELAFSVTGKPGWMEFDSQSGALTGHPSGKDVGKYKGIKIRVSDGTASAELDNIDVEVIPATGSANQPPQISGTPSSAVLVGTFYAFVPTVSDPEGDPLSFTIQNLPRWASFDPANGRLSGMPTAADVGTYTGITITVADGELRDALGPFAIQVITVATGTASLSWLPPTENEDGSALGDLGGYIVYWGAESRNYASSATIDNLAVTGYVVDNLIPGETYYFSVTAYNLSGIESSFSNEGSKTIQ
jgi:hypothetical protein